MKVVGDDLAAANVVPYRTTTIAAIDLSDESHVAIPPEAV
jgi:hypothetical protein